MSSIFESGIVDVGDEIAQSRERTRGWLAVTVMVLLTLVVAVILRYIYVETGNDSAKLMITGIFTPIIGIAGTVLGFYFGKPSD